MSEVKFNLPTLAGSKTYIIAGVIGIATAARYLGYLSESTYQLVLGLLGAGGLAALRAGVAKEKKKRP